MGRTIRFAVRSKAADAFKKTETWKPPRGVTNEGNYAHLLSGNILYDPGVELFIGNAVESLVIHDWNDRTGEDHFTLPVYDDACTDRQRWPNGDCVSYYDLAQWVSLGSPYTVTGDLLDSAWHVTRLDPFLGDFCMAWWRWNRGSFGNPLTLLVLSPGLPGYSARVEGGDLVTWSVRAQIYDYAPPSPSIFTGSAGDPTISPLLYYYDQDGNTIVGGGSYYQTLGLSYAEHSYQTTAPSGSYFVRAMIAFVANIPNAYTDFDAPTVLVDSGILSIE